MILAGLIAKRKKPAFIAGFFIFKLMWIYLRLLLLILLAGCNENFHLALQRKGPEMTGSEFYKIAAAYAWKQRDSLAVAAISKGNIPSFLKQFKAVHVSITDSVTGKQTRATYFVSPDYLSVGSDGDWARINITPMAAQLIADSLDCFLPTRKMVNDIYSAADLKLEPVPLYAFRDSTPTMWHHHLIIEGQRKQREGLIAGIKKDVVLSGRVPRDQRPDRVAIYGWHRLNGVPIQPLYTGHIKWWVDYSQGIRLVARSIRVDGRWMDYVEVLKHPVYRKLICDEPDCDFYRY
jgi:hypothetical protein